MEGLKHLSVAIYLTAPNVDEYFEESFFGPLRCLVDVIEVEVDVSWKSRLADETWPFVLRRKDTRLIADDPWRCIEDE